MNETLHYYILMIPVLLLSLTFHEVSHGYIAYRLGDMTAKNEGRLTLNPLKHLDPVGTLVMFVAGIGWAKPVPVNPFYFRDQKKGMMLTSVAGPLSNILLAFVSVFPLEVTIITNYESILAGTGFSFYLYQFLRMLFIININLAVFNLLPIPPLDGSKILSAVLPTETYFRFMQYERYIGLAFLIAIVFLRDGFGQILGFFTTPIAKSMLWVAEKIIGLFI